MIEIAFKAIYEKWEVVGGLVAGLAIYHFLFKSANRADDKTKTPKIKITAPRTYDEDNHVFRDTDLGGEQEQRSTSEEQDYNEDELSHVSFTPTERPESEMIERSQHFYEEMNKRRSCRFISSKPVPKEVIENIIRTGGMYYHQYFYNDVYILIEYHANIL